MGKCAILFTVLFLFALTAGCGGDGGSGSGTVGTSMVQIHMGDRGRSARITVEKFPLLAKAGRLVRAILDAATASAAIPSDITHIVFTISAPDMTTITRDIPVAGKSSISESFVVPNGANRRFLVEALYRETVHYRKETFANLDGRPLTLVMDMEDVDPPSFRGVTAATAQSSSRIDLSWEPATDNVTPASQLTYLVYMASSAGGQNFQAPSFTTAPGATSYSVTGLNPATTYYFVVRCSDGGTRDANSVEVSATTMKVADTSPPRFAGLVSASVPAGAAGIAYLSWEPAADDGTETGALVYLVYMATKSGAQNFDSPNFTTPAGATSYSVGGLGSGTYYFVVRARDSAGNSDTNTVERSCTILY